MQAHRQVGESYNNGRTWEVRCACGTGFFMAGTGRADAALARHIALAKASQQ